MSWTLLLFGEEPLLAKSRSGSQPRSMGSGVHVRERIDAALGGPIVWFADGWGQFGDDRCMLEFLVPENEDPVVCVMIHVRGMGAVATLSKLATQNGWCLVDDSLTPMSVSEDEPGRGRFTKNRDSLLSLRRSDRPVEFERSRRKSKYTASFIEWRRGARLRYSI